MRTGGSNPSLSATLLFHPVPYYLMNKQLYTVSVLNAAFVFPKGSQTILLLPVNFGGKFGGNYFYFGGKNRIISIIVSEIFP